MALSKRLILLSLLFSLAPAILHAKDLGPTVEDRVFKVVVLGADSTYRIRIFRPSENAKTVAVVVLPGSGAGLPEESAKEYAKRGYVGVAVEYFGYNPAGTVPFTITGLPLDGFKDVLQYLRQQAASPVNKVILRGRSRGGELALLLAAHYGHLIDGVITEVPSAYVWGDRANGSWSRLIPLEAQAPASGKEVSSWTFEGHEVPFVPMNGLLQDRAKETTKDGLPLFDFTEAYKNAAKGASVQVLEQARIKVENIRAPILVTGGKSDGLWPSGDYADLIKKKRHAMGLRDDVFLIEDVGHIWSSVEQYILFPSGAYDLYLTPESCSTRSLNSMLKYDGHKKAALKICEERPLKKYLMSAEYGINSYKVPENSEANERFKKAEDLFLSRF